MDFVFVFCLFVGCMAVSLWAGISMVLPLAVGFFLFAGAALHRGFSVRQIFEFAKGSFKDSLIVVRILLLIGCLTGSWRASGTVAYFVTLGVQIIPPSVFLLAAFLLSSLMSFALGTSFGVTATAGVILITIARAGGINTILVAGAILSGVYVGDRGSPASSSANLVAVLTHTDMGQNVRRMLRSSALPFLICCILYMGMSFFVPMRSIDTTILNQLAQEFHLHWSCLLPALLMILLPFCGVKIPLAMSASLGTALLVTVLVQQQSLADFLRAMVLGFTPADSSLSSMLSGGGLLSMVQICCILMISGTYGGIFRGTDMLAGLNRRLHELAKRLGRFPVMLGMSALVSGLFCNQTISIIMQNQLSGGLYQAHENDQIQKMLDIENSVVLIAGMVPWCIACSVPLSMLGVDARAVPFGFYLWLVPLLHLLAKKKQP